MISALWRLKSPLQKAQHAMRIMLPCRGELIRLGISQKSGYFDISYLATEVAPTKYPTRPTTVPHAQQKNLHITKNQIIKTKKPNVSSVFILTLLIRLINLLTDEINHQVN